MTAEHADLGQLIAEHEEVHDRVVHVKAELGRISQEMGALSERLRQHPENVQDEELKENLDTAYVARVLVELRQASQREEELAHRLNESGKGYVVDGLRNRRAPPAEGRVRERDLFAQPG